MHNPIKPMSDEDISRLRVISEKLKGVELFPKPISILDLQGNVIISDSDIPNEIKFKRDTQLFRDEVKIISKKIADFFRYEHELLADKLKDIDNNEDN